MSTSKLHQRPRGGTFIARGALLLPLLSLPGAAHAAGSAAAQKPAATSPKATPAAAAAPKAATSPAVSPAAVSSPARDTVTTRSGGSISGWVTRYLPSAYVIVKTDTASVTVAASEVLSVAFADRGAEAGSEVAARMIAAGSSPASAPSATSVAPSAAAAAASATKPATLGDNAQRAAQLSLALAATGPKPAAAGTTSTSSGAAPGPEVTVRSWVDTKAGTAGQSTTGPDGSTLTHEANLRQGLLRREEVAKNGDRSSTELNAFSTRVSHASSVSCADLNDPHCSKQARISVGADGLGAELKQTHAAAVKTPPNGFAVFALDAGVLGITSDAVRGLAGQAALGVRGAVGPQLPGKKGGGWSGLGLELQAGAASGKVGVATGRDVIEVDYQFGSLNAAIGWQYLHFGELDPQTLKQGGFGLFLGYRGGVNKDLGNSESELAVGHGPQIGISFPSYNAGTASVSDFTIKAMLLPTGDVTLAALTLGYGF